jgi:hypothetical protein
LNAENNKDLKWGCLPWVLIVLGVGIIPTPLMPVGIVMIIGGAMIGGYGWGKGK